MELKKGIGLNKSKGSKLENPEHQFQAFSNIVMSREKRWKWEMKMTAKDGKEALYPTVEKGRNEDEGVEMVWQRRWCKSAWN